MYQNLYDTIVRNIEFIASSRDNVEMFKDICQLYLRFLIDMNRDVCCILYRRACSPVS